MLAQSRTAPPAPSDFDQKAFFAGTHWHQKWEVFRGLFTPGCNDIEQMCADLDLPAKLSGKRVLDIGAWNGCLSFECERRGAREVVALSPEDPGRTGFQKLQGLIGSRRVRYVRGTVYNLDPKDLGHFDIVLFCGVLYHLRYPMVGIDNIRRVCKGQVYVETVVSDGQLLIKKDAKIQQTSMAEMSAVLQSVPLWQFYRRDELHGDPSNWFGPNCCAVMEAFESAGFAMQMLKNCGRATFRGRVKQGPPEFLLIGTPEGVHYDVVTGPILGARAPDEESSITTCTRSFHEKVLTGILCSEEYYHQNGCNNGTWYDSLNARLLGFRPPPQVDRQEDTISLRIDTTHRRTVLRSVFSSSQYRVRLIEGLYADYLERGVSAAETSTWLGVFDQWPSIEFLQAEFLGSDEYFNKQGGSNERWLDHLRSLLLEQAATFDRDSYLSALQMQTMTRVQLALAILESADYRRRLVQKLYLDFLARPASDKEIAHWLNTPEKPGQDVNSDHGATWPRRIWRALRAG